MCEMRTFGFGLLILGVLVLALGGMKYSSQRTVIDAGPIHATATEHHNVPFSPIIGGTAILGGLVLLFMRRQTT